MTDTSKEILHLIETCLAEKDPIKAIGIALGNGGPDTVVGKMEKKGWFLNALYRALEKVPCWYAQFYRLKGLRPIKDSFATGETPAVAISEAAKAALERGGSDAQIFMVTY